MEEIRNDNRNPEPAEGQAAVTDTAAALPDDGAAGGEEHSQAASFDYDYHDAVIQIEMLFQSHILSFGYKEYSLETYADRGFFQRWKAREGCRETDEMRSGLNIDGILRSGAPSESEVLTYLQYVLNIAELCRRSFNGEEARGYDFDIRNYTELLSRIRAILARLRYDVRYVPEREFVYLLPHDAAAEAASQDESDPLSRDITEYRSTTAVGQLDRKRQLLDDMGRRIEQYPDNLSRDNAALFGRIQFMLGNLNIRTDNINGENRIERVAVMSEAELEHWYDETYQLLLLRILEHQGKERMEAVDALADECGIDISSISEDEIAKLLNGQFEDEPEEDYLPYEVEDDGDEVRKHGSPGGSRRPEDARRGAGRKPGAAEERLKEADSIERRRGGAGGKRESADGDRRRGDAGGKRESADGDRRHGGADGSREDNGQADRRRGSGKAAGKRGGDGSPEPKSRDTDGRQGKHSGEGSRSGNSRGAARTPSDPAPAAAPPSGPSTSSTRKVILAVVIADILFVLFVLCWIFVFHGV